MKNHSIDNFEDDEYSQEFWDELEKEDEFNFEILKAIDPFIHSLEYLTFHEKTWLVISRNGLSANELCKELEISKYKLSKCRANPSYDWELAIELIKRCEEIGIPCKREREGYEQQI